MPDQPTVYQIATLRDIFELPTYQHMERCLEEITRGMLQARATCDLLNMVAEDTGQKNPAPFVWTGSCSWTDDGKRDITGRYSIDGKPFMEVRTTERSEPTQPA